MNLFFNIYNFAIDKLVKIYYNNSRMYAPACEWAGPVRRQIVNHVRRGTEQH